MYGTLDMSMFLNLFWLLSWLSVLTEIVYIYDNEKSIAYWWREWNNAFIWLVAFDWNCYEIVTALWQVTCKREKS